MTQFSEFLSTRRHTSKSDVTLWKYLATVTGSSQKTNRYLSRIYTDLTKLLSPCGSIDWTKSETIRSPQKGLWLLQCPEGEQSRHQAFPGHYLPQLNTNYCYLRWKIIHFLWIQQNMSGMLQRVKWWKSLLIRLVWDTRCVWSQKREASPVDFPDWHPFTCCSYNLPKSCGIHV